MKHLHQSSAYDPCILQFISLPAKLWHMIPLQSYQIHKKTYLSANSGLNGTYKYIFGAKPL